MRVENCQFREKIICRKCQEVISEPKKGKRNLSDCVPHMKKCFPELFVEQSINIPKKRRISRDETEIESILKKADSLMNTPLASSPPSSNSIGSLLSPKASESIERLLISPSNLKRERFKACIVRCMVLSGMPLSFFDDHGNTGSLECFIAGLRSFDSSVTVDDVPKYHEVKSIVNKWYEYEIKDFIKEMKSVEVTGVMTDSWSGECREHTVNILFGGKHRSPIYALTFEYGVERQDIRSIASMIYNNLTGISGYKEVQYSLWYFISDNCAAAQGALDLLIDEHFKWALKIGCFAHSVDLIIKNLACGCKHFFEGFQNLVKKVADICKFFRNHGQIFEQLKLEQYSDIPDITDADTDYDESVKHVKKFLLYTPTRWGSLCSMMKNIVNNKEFLISFAMNHISQTNMETISELVMDAFMWRDIEFVIHLIDPIDNIRLKCESDNKVWYSDIIRYMRAIEKHLREMEFTQTYQVQKENIIHHLQSVRFDKIKKGMSCIYLAWILDPRYRCNGANELKENYNECAQRIDTDMEVIVQKMNLHPNEKYHVKKQDAMGEIVRWLALDVTNDPAVSMFIQGKGDDPAVFWDGSSPLPVLQKICKIIFSLPVSSAACERAWSMYGNMWSDDRINLSREMRHKLMWLKWNMTRQHNLQVSHNEAEEKE